MPPVALSLVGLGLTHLLPAASGLRGWSGVCRLAAGFLFALWVERFVPERWVFLALAGSAWTPVQIGGGGAVRGALVLLLDLVGLWAAVRGLVSRRFLFSCRGPSLFCAAFDRKFPEI